MRLADNYCLLAATPEAAEDAFTQATAALTAEGLAPNARKSRIRGHANPEDLFLLEGQEPDPVSDMWLLVPGGQCRYGDNARPVGIAPLLWTATPVTPHYLGEPGSGVPVTRVSHKDAAAIARARRPPARSAEWEWMAAGAGRRRYPWGEAEWDPSLAALLPAGSSGPIPAGRFPAGPPRGDAGRRGQRVGMDRDAGHGQRLRHPGRLLASQPAYARTTFLNAAPAALRPPGLGFRVVRDP